MATVIQDSREIYHFLDKNWLQQDQGFHDYVRIWTTFPSGLVLKKINKNF